MESTTEPSAEPTTEPTAEPTTELFHKKRGIKGKGGIE